MLYRLASPMSIAIPACKHTLIYQMRPCIYVICALTSRYALVLCQQWQRQWQCTCDERAHTKNALCRGMGCLKENLKISILGDHFVEKAHMYRRTFVPLARKIQSKYNPRSRASRPQTEVPVGCVRHPRAESPCESNGQAVVAFANATRGQHKSAETL